ncbi:MAG: NifB/NifX family molybdenum-iron cluster-binding protein [Pirellulales bacterium]|nr:NifB/NifX family molybdenum-iron cluster-binding protein [Pirellulales bacterium]
MKIVVTAQGSDLDSPVDPRFGRARYFVVVDTDSGKFSAHDNTQNLNAAQGAGIQAGRTITDLGVEAVLTGNVGPKAFATLQAANIKIYPGATGTVREAVNQFKAGQLTDASKANVQGHWM